MFRKALRVGAVRIAAVIIACTASLLGGNAQIKTTLLTLPGSVTDYLWDATRARIYASTDCNSISIIDPSTAQVEGSFPADGCATQLQTSSDGRYLYAFLSQQSVVRRYDLDTRTMDLEIALGPNAAAFAPLPGQSRSVVASYGVYGTLTAHFAVFDGAVKRPGVASAQTNYGASGGLSLYFRPRDGSLFAAGGGRIFWLEINVSGVTIKRSAPTPFYGGAIWKGDVVVDGTGHVFDLQKWLNTGRVTVPVRMYPPDFGLDAQGASLLVIEDDGLSAFLTRYSVSTFLPVAYAVFDRSPGEMFRGQTALTKSWGADGMAMSNGRQFLLFHLSDMGAPQSNPPAPVREVSGVIRFPFSTGGLAFDPARGVLWASVPGSVPSIGNSVVAINPGSGEIVDTIYAGSDPGALALSNDGNCLFTALRGSPTIVPIDIAHKTVGAPFTVLDASAPDDMYWVAKDLLAAPGGSNSVAVLRSASNFGLQRSVLVYDGGVPRQLSFTKAVDALVPADTPDSVYAVNLTTTTGAGSELYRLALEPDGVALARQLNWIDLGPRAYRPIVYSNGALFTSAGGMWTADVDRRLGSFDAVGIPVPFPERNQVAYVGTEVTLFDLTTFRPQATVSIGSQLQALPVGALRAGANMVALYTEQETVLVPLTSLDAWPSVPRVAQDAGAGVRRLDIPVNELAVSPGSSKLLLATPSAAGELGNSVVSVDPETGRIEEATFAGSEPTMLSPAADGAGVWVSLAGERRVARIRPSAGLRDLVFAADPTGGSRQYPAYDMAAGPDGGLAISYYGGAIAVFDDGKPRSAVEWNDTGDFASQASEYSLTFNGTGNILYAYNVEYSTFDLKRCRVSQEGLTWLSAADSLIGGYYTKIRFARGLLYSSNGAVVDPERSRIVGRFAMSWFDLPRDVLPDAENGRVYFKTEHSLLVFDMYSYSLIGSLPVVLPSWPDYVGYSPRHRSNMVKVGSDMIAVNAGTVVYLIRISSIPMLPAPVPSPQTTLPSTPGVAVVDLAAKDLAYDPLRDRIYATVPNREAALGDRIAVIHPGTATVVATYAAGPNPHLLALSGDQSQLHYTMGRMLNPAFVSSSVRTLDLNTGTIGPKFGEPAATSAGWTEILALAAVPGEPRSVALADNRYELQTWGTTQVYVNIFSYTVRLYDSGVARPDSLEVGCSTMQAGATGSRLYCATYNSFSQIAVDSAGAKLVSTSTVTQPGQMKFSGGRLYTTTGLVIEAETMKVIGSVPVKGAVAVDGGRVFWLESVDNAAQPTFALRSFDALTLQPIGTKEIKVTMLDDTPLIPCGQGRLAFRAGKEIYIVYPSDNIPQPPPISRGEAVNGRVGRPAPPGGSR